MKFGFALPLLIAITASCSTTPSDDGDDDGAAITETPMVTSDVADDDLANDATPTPPPHLEAFFNVPLADGTGDNTLQNKVVELIGLAVPGSHVRMSMFNFTHMAPAEAFVTAANNGVHVDLIIDREANLVAPSSKAILDVDNGVDDEIVDGAYEASDDDDAAPADATPAAAKVLNPTVKYLVDHASANLTITFCTRGDGSCQGTHIDHNKIYMFSHLSDGSKYVVVQSSANLTTYKLHNALVVSRNDKDLYDGYVSYWHDLHAKHEDLNYYRSVDGNHTIAYFFPRADGDTIVSILDKVKCTKAHPGTVRVAMAFFDDGRSAIADRLAKLASTCDVQVVMRHAGTSVSADIIHTLKHGGVKVGEYPDAKGSNIHSKYLVIDALYDTKGKGYVRRKLVFTGSHNYTGGALRHNDEALLRVDNATVYDAFTANWKTIRAQIK